MSAVRRPRATTMSDLWAPVEQRPLRKLPSLVLASCRLLWAAARREFVLVAALQVLSGAAAGVQLLLIKNLLGAILAAGPGGDLGPMVPWLAGLAGLVLVTTLSGSAQWELQRLLSELVVRRSTERIFDVAGAADLETFETPEFHNRLERAWMSGGARPLQITQSVLGLISSATAVLGVMVALFAVLPLLVPLVALGGIPILVLTSRSSRAFHAFNWRMTPLDRRRTYLSRVLTHRQHAHEVIAFELGDFLRARWRGLHDQRLAELRQLVRHRLAVAVLVALGNTVLLVAPVVLVTALLVSGAIELPQAVTAATAVVLVRPALQGLMTSGAQLYECALFLDDYEGFVRLKDELAARRDGGAPATAFSTLSLEEVGFTYPGAEEPALRDISLDIQAGEVVALVGENGSGKTTLAKVLSGLYRPGAGQVRWDGVDAEMLQPEARRRLVAVLFQDFCQYFLSTRDNIGVGRPERIADAAAIVAAAGRAGADRFIEALPDGYETLLGPEFEGGHNLSVGQWQRLALARAFLRDAPFVILDEPTAALDARAEHELFASIRTLFRGRTVLLISHRFSSVRTADRIYVLHQGRIVEQGTHAELMALGGQYAELFLLQAAAYQTPVATAAC